WGRTGTGAAAVPPRALPALPAVHDRRPDALGAETQRVAALVFEPEQRTLPHAEEDAALELERRVLPPGAECDLAVIRGESDPHRGNPLPQRHTRVEHHARTLSGNAISGNTRGAPQAPLHSF